ncbi:bifunctional 5,10-methylenetetrahydrofolate dehydrogenase/5,10-methenyltetrahydrofolate cyclohydrolase [Patescibacteria group bacterium]|nr:MAG: bifunctional 5,10-methylenetetrahydrofolate dehydrogenase/5,10-methenyltetrahydrofolate cyclohydrolase [Patescibacteria group bacterium]
MSHLIDGRTLARKIRASVKDTVEKMSEPPRLAVILVGDDQASHLYVSLKEKAAAEVGIAFEKHLFPDDVTERAVLEEIRKLNERPEVDAILVQLPLPEPLDAVRLVSAIAAEKEVDGFHPQNLEAMRRGQPFMVPGVIEGIALLIEESGANLEGQQALLLVNSETFALPLTLMLKGRGLKVVMLKQPIARDEAVNLGRQSAVIVTALGEPKFITGEMVADGAVLIDVGTTRLHDGKIAGDVHADDFKNRDVWLTPVPGGVGPVTVAMLLVRTLALAQKRRGQTSSPE